MPVYHPVASFPNKEGNSDPVAIDGYLLINVESMSLFSSSLTFIFLFVFAAVVVVDVLSLRVVVVKKVVAMPAPTRLPKRRSGQGLCRTVVGTNVAVSTSPGDDSSALAGGGGGGG